MSDEVTALRARVAEPEWALQQYIEACLYADKDTLQAAIAAAHKEAIRLVPRRVRRPHVESSGCWCNPTLYYRDPKTGRELWVHHEPS